MSIPRRPSENFLDSAEQHMGGSPMMGRPPFAGASTPGGFTSAGRQTTNMHGASAGRTAAGNGAPADPMTCAVVARLSVSPQLPFAFTPQPLSASSLASGLHPLAQISSPTVSGSGGSADMQSRFALALRPSSWTSPASSLVHSSSAGALLSASPAYDAAAAHSPVAGAHPQLRLGRDAPAGSPDDGVDAELDSELEPLPFALEDVFGESADEAADATAFGKQRLVSARHVWRMCLPCSCALCTRA